MKFLHSIVHEQDLTSAKYFLFIEFVNRNTKKNKTSAVHHVNIYCIASLSYRKGSEKKKELLYIVVNFAFCETSA
jgi:hypothetical protein